MAVKRAVQPALAAGVNFGDLGMYVAGSSIPEGNYALTYDVQYEQESENYKPKVPRLGVLLTAYPLNGKGDPKTKFLSMGTKAHESFAPNPDTGKGVVPVAGGSGALTLSQSSNWAVHLKSLYDSGLPQGVFTNDLTVLDGVHAHVSAAPEPEERKGFRNAARSTEVEQADQPKGGGTIPVVTEIKDGGAPWEGGGGIPDPVAAASAPKPNGKVIAGKPGPAARRPAAPPPPVEATEASEEDVMNAAINGITAVLEKNPNGAAKLVLRTGTFKAVAEAEGEDMANAVIDNIFGDDPTLSSALEQLGYKVQGMKVVPA